MISRWLFFTSKKSSHGSWKISKKSRASKVALIRWLLYTIMSVPYQPDPGKPGPPWACLLSFRRCPSGSLTWAHPRPEWGCSKACGAQHSLLSKVTYIRFVVRGDIADLEQLFANLLLVRSWSSHKSFISVETDKLIVKLWVHFVSMTLKV